MNAIKERDVVGTAYSGLLTHLRRETGAGYKNHQLPGAMVARIDMDDAWRAMQCSPGRSTAYRRIILAIALDESLSNAIQHHWHMVNVALIRGNKELFDEHLPKALNRTKRYRNAEGRNDRIRADVRQGSIAVFGQYGGAS
jgi:hypothetical protein